MNNKNNNIFIISNDVKRIGENAFDISTLYCTSNIDEIDSYQRSLSDKHLSLYLQEDCELGDYKIDDHIFYDYEYFDYIEIPTNYLNNTNNVLKNNSGNNYWMIL